MSEFSELFHVDSFEALKFFFSHLKETKSKTPVSREETLYVASILAHDVQTSRYESTSIPSFLDLTEIFDNFICTSSGVSNDPEVMEYAGARSLVLNGFFRDQMRGRHNVRWYDEVGKSFYENACYYSKDRERRKLLRYISEHFSVWTMRCCDLNRAIRDIPYLIKPPNKDIES